MTNIIVTITPPTPNGDLHIGHLAGPFLGADVFTRCQRQRGYQCVLVSYSDDYESYMLRRGLELGRSPVDLAKENTAKIRDSLRLAGVQIDNWMSPHQNPHYVQAVTEVFRAAEVAGAIEWRDSDEPYCSNCNAWGYEAFGRGNCNHCGSDSDASQCEHCARTPNASKMQNFRCKLCGAKHEWRPVNRAFLKLSDFSRELSDVSDRATMRKSSRAWLRQVIGEGLEDWGLTRPGDGGLDLTSDGSHRTQTWFMSLPGYIASFRELCAKNGASENTFADYWRSEDSHLVHFLGYDCLFSHAVAAPALLMCLPELKVKQSFFANHFLTLNGSNLSTSRNHAIWIRDLIAEACSDSARLYLASVAPEEHESDFNVDVFRAWREALFVHQLPEMVAAAAAESEPGSHWLSGATSYDHALVLSARVRWLEATSLSNFSIKALASLVLDMIAVASDRRASGRSVRHLMILIATLGKSLHPDLSDQIFAACAADEAEVLRDVINGTINEYSI
jgi:methionyl-tRNA synthetase